MIRLLQEYKLPIAVLTLLGWLFLAGIRLVVAA